MGRPIRANFYARKSLPRLIAQIGLKPRSEWPAGFQKAWSLLHDDLKISDAQALTILVYCIEAARRYFGAQNHEIAKNLHIDTRFKLLRLYRRIANCAKRAPAALRRALNARVLPLIDTPEIDLEVIQSMLLAAEVTFKECRDWEESQAVLTLLKDIDLDEPSRLDMASRERSEKSLSDFVRQSPKEELSAAHAFAALAEALEVRGSETANSQIHRISVKYVAELAQIWRSAGLRPGWARNDLERKYKGRFHRFTEHVLEGLANEDESHSDLGPRRSIAGKQVVRTYYKFQISDDDVRVALRG